jgi:hypothetical protein
MNPKLEMDWGAHASRVQFSASSRKTSPTESVTGATESEAQPFKMRSVSLAPPKRGEGRGEGISPHLQRASILISREEFTPADPHSLSYPIITWKFIPLL